MDMNNSKSGNNMDILKNLMAAYESRMKNLTEIKDLSLELKYMLENYDDVNNYSDEDEINKILDIRAIRLQNNNEFNVTVKHYTSKLPKKVSEIISKIEQIDITNNTTNNENFKNLNELFNNYHFLRDIDKIVRAERETKEIIKTLDKENSENISRIMQDVKKKLDNIKNNRTIMEKFSNSESEIKTGSLINKKK